MASRSQSRISGSFSSPRPLLAPAWAQKISSSWYQSTVCSSSQAAHSSSFCPHSQQERMVLLPPFRLQRSFCSGSRVHSMRICSWLPRISTQRSPISSLNSRKTLSTPQGSGPRSTMSPIWISISFFQSARTEPRSSKTSSRHPWISPTITFRILSHLLFQER